MPWFHSLMPDTVDGFGTLHNLFDQQYTSSRAQSLTYLTLVKIRQGNEETLKDFMDRFNRTVRQVKDVRRKFILSSLTTTLKPGPFADNLYVEQPQALGEL